MSNLVEGVLNKEGKRIEESILEFIPRGGVKNLNDAVWYHLDAGGKRLRPVLAIVTCRALGCDTKKVMPFAAACELFHNWLLVHDDIEDGDVVRRGRETVWKKYGIGHGINVGDFMSEKVYELIMKSRDLGVSTETVLDLVSETANTAIKTAEGQAMDMNLRQDNNPSEKDYMDMIKNKTAWYLMLPIIGGAMIAGADKELIEKIRGFGLFMGPAFQMTDDLLDLTEGKGREDIGSDIREGKRSLMVVHCSSRCSQGERTRLFEILNNSRDETTKEEVLWVKDLFEQYGSLEYAREKSRELIGKAKGVIEGMPENIGRVLSDFADYMVERKR